MKSNTLSQEVRDRIKDARLKPLNEAIAANNQVNVNNAIMGFKTSEIVKLPADILTNPLVMFNFDKDVLSAMIKEETPASVRDQIRAYFDQINRTANGGSAIDKVKDWLTTPAGKTF
jgi:LPS O-antigen subunit length determinant protein (WzzB/FepE family)